MNYRDKTKEELIQKLKEARKQIEAQELELSGYKNHFELLMMASSFAWWEIDVPTGNVRFSEHKAIMLGYLPDRFKHYKDFMALVHPQDYDKTMEEMMNHLQGKAENYEAYYRIKTSTGDYKLFHDIGRITNRDSSGKPISVSGIVIDVLDKSKLDEVQRESDSRFKYMFQDNKSVMLLIEPQTGKIVDANKSAVNFYKYSIDELRAMKIEDINVLNYEKVLSERAKAIESKQNVFNFPHRISTGEIRKVEVHTTLIEFNNQQLLFSIVDDITDRLKLEDEIRKSEVELKKAELIGKFGNWNLHLNEKIITSSNGACIIYGFESTKNTLDKVQKQALSEYRSMLDQALFNLINHGLSYDVEYKIKRESDGKIIDIHSIAEYDPSTNIVFGTVQDISERKMTEAAMRQSEEKFRSLYANMIDGSALHTLVYNDQDVPVDYVIIDVNPAFELLLGISRDTVINKTSREAYGVEDPPYFDIYSRVALTGKPEVFETYFAPLNMYFSISVFCPYTGSFATIFENITERKKAEQSLQIVLAKYQVLFDIFPLGISITDAEGKINESNQIAETLLGISNKEQEKRKINGQEWRIIRPDGTTMPALEFASVRALEVGHLVANVEMGIIKDDNQITWLNVSATPIPIKGYGVAIIYDDITDRKLAEEALKNNAKKLRELNATKDKFFSIIAHDLKSPFSGILGFSEILRDEARNLDIESIEEYANILNSTAKQTFKLLENLLDWARMQQGGFHFEPKTISFNTLLKIEIDGLKYNADQKNITLVNRTAKEIIFTADEKMMSAVLRNLISNAIKFTPKDGKINIEAKIKIDSIEVSISDTGVGMEKETIENLFKIETSFTSLGTENENGTGLGLLLCKEFIEKHGGTIWVESEKGKGSRFTFSIAIAPIA